MRALFFLLCNLDCLINDLWSILPMDFLSTLSFGGGFGGYSLNWVAWVALLIVYSHHIDLQYDCDFDMTIAI